jgi:protein gp37
MSNNSLIEWTQDTWNPVTGCTKISQGCAHCYAERLARRLQKMGNPRYNNGFQLTLHEDLLKSPLSKKQPRMIFVNSMSDIFHEDIPLEFIERIFQTMNAASWHTFQILTKRSKRMASLAPYLKWTSNIWMGVTIENQEWTSRISDLKTVPAYVRFLSCEPLLSSISMNLEQISWVIVGGESGPNSRLMQADWVRSIMKQCQNARIPFFFKQWGGDFFKKGHDKAVLDGVLYKEWPTHFTSGKRNFVSADQPVPLLAP